MKAKDVVNLAPNSSGVQALSLDQVASMPLAQYHSLAGHFVNVQNAVYYDTAVYTGGTAITEGQKASLFQKGKANDATVVNTGVQIPEKGEYMTNMISDGEFEGGTTFILEQICVDWFLTSEQPTTLGTRGEITAPNYTASVVISAANHHKAIRDQFALEYLRNEEVKMRAPLFCFPSPYGASGSFGSPNSGFIQNGGYGGIRNMLSRAVVLQSEDKFNFVIRPVVATWTPTLSFNIRVLLVGKRISNITV